MLIFDRTNLHCSSSVIDGKKLGLTTLQKNEKVWKKLSKILPIIFRYFQHLRLIEEL